jgi:hypothetical protein
MLTPEHKETQMALAGELITMDDHDTDFVLIT